ncbi:MAG: hypothetical protein OEM52_07910, partial [bacterium]|nr:hypothetical protein [bacterium]
MAYAPKKKRMKKSNNIPTYAITAAVIGLLLRLWLILAAPLQSDVTNPLPAFNDELSHFHHILYQRDVGSIPLQKLQYVDEAALATGGAEYWQPPLYYQLSAFLLKAVGTVSHPERMIRLFSLGCWIVGLGFLLAFVPNPQWRTPILLGGSLLGAGLPASVTVNNDALMALFVGAFFACTTVAARRRLGWLQLFVWGGLLAFGVYAKLPALTLWPMVIFAIWFGEANRLIGFIKAAMVELFAFLLTLPLWLQRIEFYGHPIGFRHAPEITLREALIAFGYSSMSPWQEPWSSPFVKFTGVVFCLALLASTIYLFLHRKQFWIEFTGSEKLAERM